MQDTQATLTPNLAEASRGPLAARPLVRLGLLIAVIAAAHGFSVISGLWLDDHLHYQNLRDGQWSYRDLINASTLDNSTTHSQIWGTMDHGLHFYRPVAFGLMKAEYTLVGWRPAWMHVLNLGWHLAVAMLIGALVGRLLNDGAAGTFAAVLFAVFPNHVATVYWIACQTELMVTTFILTAVLGYGTWAGWFERQTRRQGDKETGSNGRSHGNDDFTAEAQRTQRKLSCNNNDDNKDTAPFDFAQDKRAEARTPNEDPAEAGTHTNVQASSLSRHSMVTNNVTMAPEGAAMAPNGSTHYGWLVLALAAFVLAMGCRENAIVLPGILIAGDVLTHGVKIWRRRMPAWLVMAGLALVYLLLRRAAMGGMAWPPRPYLIYPSDPDFVEFVTRKMLYYLSGLFLYLPILPGSAAEYFEQKTWILPIGAAVSLLVPVAAGLLWRRWIVLLGVVWIVLIFGPSIGVALSPHHLYLPGVGAMLLLTAALLGLWRAVKRRLPLLQRAEPVASGALGATLLAASLLVSLATGWLYVSGTAAEDQVAADVLERGDPLASGDELFFINLPLMCGWPGPAIETTAGNGLRDLKTYVLTLSDEVVMMTQPTQVVPLDRHRLRLRTGSPGWLVGISGKIFAELSRTEWPYRAGQFVPGPAFDATVEEVDSVSGGVTQLLFVFHEPIDKPGRHFYLGSPYQMAYPLHFAWGRSGVVTGP